MKGRETPDFTYKGITEMSVFCLLLLGYACCGCGSANVRQGNGCGSWNGCNSCGSWNGCGGCGSWNCRNSCGSWGSTSVLAGSGGCSCGCTGFGSRSGICCDTAYYNRQYALCGCCNN